MSASLATDPIHGTIQIILNALSLVVALAWNTAFSNYFQSQKWLKVYGPWIYAISITVIVTIIMVLVSKLDIKKSIVNI